MNSYLRAPWRTTGTCIVWVLSALGMPLQAQSLKDDTKLFDKADGQPQGGTLAQGTGVKLHSRAGFWVEVDAGGRRGWLKASSISYAGQAGGPTAIDTGRLGKGNIVATSAARGLSAKDLLQGTPKPEEVAKLAAFAPDAASQKAFATQGAIKPAATKVALKSGAPAPRAPAAAGNANNVGAGSAASNAVARKKDGDEW